MSTSRRTSRGAKVLAAVFSAALAMSACGPEPRDPERAARNKAQADAFGLPLGSIATPQIEHPPVPPEAPERVPVSVEREVLVAPDRNQPATYFYRGVQLAVGPDGNLFLLDNGARRIHVFDESGSYRGSLGGPGQGPEDLGRLSGRVAVTNEHIVYLDPYRLLVWTRSGEHVRTRRMRFRATGIDSLVGTSRGELAAAWGTRGAEDRLWKRMFGSVSTDGEVRPFAERADHPLRRDGPREPEATLSVGWEGIAYLVASDRYEVLAIDVNSGEELWWLHVDWPEVALSRTDRERFRREYLARNAVDDRPNPDPESRRFEFPEHYPALSSPSKFLATSGQGHPARVDGRGRLLLFPYVVDPQPSTPYPVDLYDSTGAFVGAYLLPRISWYAAHLDHVYGFELNEADERVLVRYKLSF